MTIKRRALSILLSLAVIFTFMPFVSTQAYAASKQPLVTKQVDNDGTTNTYSYNAKGLVKKMVSKNSSSENDSDSKYSATTTFKYNKKNKISSQTTKATLSTTSYRTDNTTKKQRVAKLGTVKDKYNTVTKYTYKKGLATKAVTTETNTKSGSETNARYNLYGYTRKLGDGSYAKGYWDDDDKYVVTEIITPAEAAAKAKPSTTVDYYKDNGNGTYTWTHTDSEDPDDNDSVTNKNQTVTTTNYKYKKKNVKKATKSEVTTSESTSTDTDGTVHKSSTVTTKSPVTTSYTYKKGRVSKKVISDPGTWTKVSTYTTTDKDGNVAVDTYTEDAYGNWSWVYTYNNVVKESESKAGKNTVYPTKKTYNYKYDKNGNLKSYNGKETNKKDTTLRDEVFYSSDIPVIVSASNTDYVKTPVSTVTKWSESFQNTVKKGTKKLLTAVGMYKSSTDGRADYNKGSYSMSRTKYTLKSKKYAKKASANVEAQQWMIQNGVFKVPGLW